MSKTDTTTATERSEEKADHPPGIPHPELTYEIQRQIDEAHWDPAFKIEDTREINSGYCRSFAMNVVQSLEDDAIEIVSINGRTGRHYWLRLDGRHYDAEVPKGVDDFRELPYWQRNGVPDMSPTARESDT